MTRGHAAVGTRRARLGYCSITLRHGGHPCFQWPQLEHLVVDLPDDINNETGTSSDLFPLDRQCYVRVRHGPGLCAQCATSGVSSTPHVHPSIGTCLAYHFSGPLDLADGSASDARPTIMLGALVRKLDVDCVAPLSALPDSILTLSSSAHLNPLFHLRNLSPPLSHTFPFRSIDRGQQLSELCSQTVFLWSLSPLPLCSDSPGEISTIVPLSSPH